jgi:hypothetical protein
MIPGSTPEEEEEEESKRKSEQKGRKRRRVSKRRRRATRKEKEQTLVVFHVLMNQVQNGTSDSGNGNFSGVLICKDRETRRGDENRKGRRDEERRGEKRSNTVFQGGLDQGGDQGKLAGNGEFLLILGDELEGLGVVGRRVKGQSGHCSATQKIRRKG